MEKNKYLEIKTSFKNLKLGCEVENPFKYQEFKHNAFNKEMGKEVKKYCEEKGISISKRSFYKNIEGIYCKGEMVTVLYDKLNKNVFLISSIRDFYVDRVY